MRRCILLLALLLTMVLRASAQNKTSYTQLPILSNDYYESVSFLKQNYNYELVNKKRSLVRNSNDIFIAGVIAAVGGGIATGYVCEQNSWSTAVSLPVSIAVAGAIAYPAVAWSNYLRKKADAIQVEMVYVLPIGRQTELGTAIFHDNNNYSWNAIGIGLKTTF